MHWTRVIGAARVLYLVIALLAGWQAALVHPIEHADGRGHLVHAGGQPHPQGNTDPSGDLCDALAALTACAASSPPPPPLAAFAHVAFFPDSLGTRSAEPPPFRSQAPPVTL